MKLHQFAAGALALALAAGAAFAADPPAGGRAAFMQTCGADVKTYCDGKAPGPDLRACVQANFTKFSKPCQDLLTEMRSRMQQGGGEGAKPN